MSTTVEAVYRDGVFTPSARPALAEGAHVRLVVEPLAQYNPEEVLRLAADVYVGLSAHDMDEVERLARRRPLFGEPTR